MTNKIFWLRTMNLFLCLMIIGSYQYIQSTRKYEEQIAELEYEKASYIEKNKALSVKLGAEQQITDERTTVWTDGVYQGTGQGFGGTISVEVVIKEGKIEDITILSAKQEDKAYLDSAIAVIEKMKEE